MAGKVYAGVDVSKEKLDVCVEGGGEFTVENCAPAIRQMLGRLARGPGEVHVCFESTGVYGRALLECCHALGVGVSQLNARRARQWAQGCGLLAKTDRIDAAMLCRYGRREQPPPAVQPEPWKLRMRELRDMREALAAARLIHGGRLEQASGEGLKRMLRGEISRPGRKIAKLDAAMSALFEAGDPALLSRLTAVKGVGKLTACLTVAAVPELGTLGGKTAAALCGVAPLDRESGKSRGKAHIGGGRPHARRALYMPAVACVRHNPILGAFYRRKRAEGKPPRVALVAVMRKLIVLMERIASDPGFIPSSTPV
jgi:transposase